ncbi:hypothetical protein DRQ15_09410 [candidate division KSB1 bacterium]|nr:MAG: hypothetical protein DRQ15_09410 [candidate division KSB1 bacterium]
MRKKIKLLDYIFLMRPVLFYPVWTVFLAGYICGIRINSGGSGNLILWQQVNSLSKSPVTFFIILFAYTSLMGAVFIINQLTDVKSDQKNNKLFLIANGYVGQTEAIIEAILLGSLALVTGFVTHWLLGLCFVVALLITGILYSSPPFLWKDRPLCGLIVNLSGGFLTFLSGWLLQMYLSNNLNWKMLIENIAVKPSMFVQALPYIFAIGSVYFLTTVTDAQGDRSTGKVTFAVKYGTKITLSYALIFEISSLILAIILRDIVILLPALFALPLFIRAYWKQDLTTVIQSTRLSILFLSLVIAIYFPLYFLLIFGVYFLSKWYYQVRFNLDYPTLSAIS